MDLKNVLKACDDALESKQLLIDHYKGENEKLQAEIRAMQEELDFLRPQAKITDGNQ